MKFAKKGLCFLLCICMALSVLLCCLREKPASAVEAKTVQSLTKEITECEALLSRLQSELALLQEQIKNNTDQTASAKEQAELAAGQIAVLEAQIELNESLMESCEIRRSTVQAEQFLVKNEIEYYNDLMAELMRFLYENGTESDFEMLFSSDGLSDYLERRDNFSSILSCVDDLRQTQEQAASRLEDLQIAYTEAQNKYSQYRYELNRKKDELDKAIVAFDKLCEQLEIDKDQLDGSFAELNQTIKETKDKLAKLKQEREVLIKQEQIQNPGGANFDQKNPASGFIWPLGQTVRYTLTSDYGKRIDPITGKGTEFHKGIDLACAKGTPILAVKAGLVTKSAWYGGYGNCVILYHGKDDKGRAVTTLYGHASMLKCNQGDQVEAGDVIALVGSTGGRSTGNHLHISVLLDGVYVNPDNYLPDGYYKKLYNS